VQAQVVSRNTQWVGVYRADLLGGTIGVMVPRDGSTDLPINTVTSL